MKSNRKTDASNRANRILAMSAGTVVVLIALGLTHPGTTPQQLARASEALEQERAVGQPIPQDMTPGVSWAEYWTAVANAAGRF